MFSSADLLDLSALVDGCWRAGADRDWSVPAGILEWRCTRTADHAVDTVFAPAFFLASRKQDGYPDMGADYSVGPDARPEQLVQALEVAVRILVAVVAEAGPEVRAVLFPPPILVTAPPEDFLPRAGVELILHAHDVCAGLGIAFEPAPGLCQRLRDHTRSWAMWTIAWDGLPVSDDPWGDLLAGSGRRRADRNRG